MGHYDPEDIDFERILRGDKHKTGPLRLHRRSKIVAVTATSATVRCNVLAAT